MPLITLMIGSIMDATQEVRPEIWRRLLTIVIDGLRARPGGATPMPVAPLTYDEVPRVMSGPRTRARRAEPRGRRPAARGSSRSTRSTRRWCPGGAGEARDRRASSRAGPAAPGSRPSRSRRRRAGRASSSARAGRGGGRTLLLCGHLDTVGVDGMADPHAPRVDGDRLLRPRRLRHEGRPRRRAHRLPRGGARAGWPATWSSPRWPTRSTRASACRRCSRRVARRRRDRHRADRARARRRAQGLRLDRDRGHRRARRTARARTSASTPSSRPGRS